MPRMIGTSFDPSATKALRNTMCKGTICCSVCNRPAVDQVDNVYYCAYHLTKKHGYFHPGRF